MKISQRGIDLIKKFEGCRLSAYKDPVGVLTIGYGHTKGVQMGDTITQEEADNLLREDLAIYEKQVMKYDDKYHWNQNQFDALVSFAYNIGSIDQLTSNGRRSIKTISDKIPEYNKAGGEVLEGLRRRRNEEKALFDEAVEVSVSGSDEEVDNLPSDSIEAQDEAHSESQGYFKIGEVYTVDVRSALNVRKGPGKDYGLVGYANLTTDGKRHAYTTGALKSGTRVTVLEERVISSDNVWVRIPSGWICAIDGDKKYVI